MDLLLHIENAYPGHWHVVDDDYDGAPDGDSPMGSGSTKYEALADYLEQIEERGL